MSYSYGDISTSGNLAAMRHIGFLVHIDVLYTTPAISLPISVTRKCRAAVGIFSLCALELEICLGVLLPPPPVAGKRRKKTVAGRRLTID